MKGVPPKVEAAFRRGSKTYFNSSVFFPLAVRRDVFFLYGFVRVADDYVDAIPQDAQGFIDFRRRYEAARASGKATGDEIIDCFLDVAQRKKFKDQWVDAFLDSMEADLSKSAYDSLEETLKYIYGSAEVIGLFMAAIMGLPEKAYPSAAALGRSMQYINFIRDIDEDNRLGRRYLPLSDSGLSDLEEKSALAHPQEFIDFMRAQAQLYLSWQAEAEAGFCYIPWKSRVPIMTASRMYNWTARRIQADPFLVFERKIKPSKARIFLELFLNIFRALSYAKPKAAAS